MSRRFRTLSVLRFVLAGGIFLALPEQGSAQGQRIELAAFVGGVSVTQDLGNVRNVYFSTSGAAVDTEFGKYFGFRAGFNVKRWLSLEGYVSQGKNSFTYTVEDDRDLGTVPLGEQFDATQLNYGGDVVLQAPFANGLVPYGTIGFGWQRSRPDDPIFGIEEVRGTDVNFGAGVKYFFVGPGVPWLGVRFEMRYHIISDGLAFFENAVDPKNTEISFGASFRF